MTTTQPTPNLEPCLSTGPYGLFVQLASVGNPDYNQNPNRPLPGLRNQQKLVGSLAEAVAACQTYINDHDLGGGNWAGGQVSLITGTPIAYISYNGRIWEPRTPNQISSIAFPPLKVIYQTSLKRLWVISGHYSLCFTQQITRDKLVTLQEVLTVSDSNGMVSPYWCQIARNPDSDELQLSLFAPTSEEASPKPSESPLASVAVTFVRK